MSTNPKLEDTVRAAIIATPDAILDDHDVMRALVAANERAMGENIVDLRGIAMDRLESRLDRLEDTHRSVIAAAYENLAGTNQVHRAILRLLEAASFEMFLADLGNAVADILRVDAVALLLETAEAGAGSARLGVLGMVAPGEIDGYLTGARGGPARQVTLREVRDGNPAIFGAIAGNIRSEACLKLDLGAERLPGLLILGSEDPRHFTPQQGTELLTFFTGVFDRSMRRWLT